MSCPKRSWQLAGRPESLAALEFPSAQRRGRAGGVTYYLCMPPRRARKVSGFDGPLNDWFNQDVDFLQSEEMRKAHPGNSNS